MYKTGDFMLPATFSDCGKYRYTWRRPLNLLGDFPVCFLMHNPSKADEERSDPTVTRCTNFALGWNATGIIVLNRFAFRSTNPEGLWETDDPVGPQNDEAIQEVAEFVHRLNGKIIVAWGQPGRKTKKAQEVFRARTEHLLSLLSFTDLYSLRVTANNIPWHPLYLPKDLEPKIWRPSQQQ